MEKFPKFVKTEIYIITCKHPESKNKQYIGQTRTHILNHKKYRSFGSQKRWLQHVSEARVNNTTKQSWKLNNSIRKYGAENFLIEILLICELEHADEYECKFIRLYDTIRNGYNLAEGGSGGPHTMDSRIQISATLKDQNDIRRIGKYKNVDIDFINLVRLGDKGIRIYVHETDGRITYTSIYGRHSTMDESISRTKVIVNVLIKSDPSRIKISRGLKDIIKFDN